MTLFSRDLDQDSESPSQESLALSWSWIYADPEIPYEWKGKLKYFDRSKSRRFMHGAFYERALDELALADPFRHYTAWIIHSGGQPLVHFSFDHKPSSQKVLTFDIFPLVLTEEAIVRKREKALKNRERLIKVFGGALIAGIVLNKLR